MIQKNLDWSFLEHFNTRHLGQSARRSQSRSIIKDWDCIAEWMESANSAQEALSREAISLASAWDKKLQHLGGDPCQRDWTLFRPLRLSREEDWADWLAHLLANSRTGFLASRLFLDSPPSLWVQPDVSREECTYDKVRRCDLLVTSRTARGATIEVKIYDQEFLKTYETAYKIQEKVCQVKDITEWSHFILLPEESLPDWDMCRSETSEYTQNQAWGNLKVTSITWKQVAIALRQCLIAEGTYKEDIPYKVWALSFCGVIEQRLLGHPRLDPHATTIRRGTTGLHEVSSFMEVMKAALEQEDQDYGRRNEKVYERRVVQVPRSTRRRRHV